MQEFEVQNFVVKDARMHVQSKRIYVGVEERFWNKYNWPNVETVKPMRPQVIYIHVALFRNMRVHSRIPIATALRQTSTLLSHNTEPRKGHFFSNIYQKRNRKKKN